MKLLMMGDHFTLYDMSNVNPRYTVNINLDVGDDHLLDGKPRALLDVLTVMENEINYMKNILIQRTIGGSD